MSSSFHLPPELWLEVFDWATRPSQYIYSTGYEPFSSPQTAEDARMLRVKYSLSLVCRDWHSLSKDFLYKDITIGPAQIYLKKVLCASEATSCAQLVRRVVLPYQYTTTPNYSSDPLASVQILKHCSQVEVLVRPRLYFSSTFQSSLETPRFEFEADSLPLPSLKRLEWNFNREADRTGGINSLIKVLGQSPNIEYLHIAGFGPRTMITSPESLHLPRLNTVSVSGLTSHIVYQLSARWDLPVLTHMIIGSINIPTISTLWEKYAEQLEVVEFGRHLTFLQREFVGPCIQNCHRMKELNYYAFFTLPPVLSEDESRSLETIGLHASPNEMFNNDPDVERSLIVGHLEALSEKNLPMLQNIRLHGDWSRFLADSHIASKLDGTRCNVFICS